MNNATDDSLKKSLIKKQTCFSQLTDREIDILADLLIERHINEGETIVVQGDPVDSVFFIICGTADVRRVFVQNNKLTYESLAKLKDGQSIGLSETGFYSLSGIRTATVVAETEMMLYRLSVAAFNGFALAHPHVKEVMQHNVV